MSQILHRLIRIHRAISLGAFALAGAALILFTATFNLEVANRYFLGVPSTWSQDVISVAALSVTFLALPYITMHSKHVQIDILTHRLGPRALARLRVVHRIIMAAVLLLIAYITSVETMKQFSRGTLIASAIAIPKWPILAVMTWGFLSSALHVVAGPCEKEGGA